MATVVELKEDSQETSAEDDLQLLLECLPYQKNSPSAQKQVLTTIATMCANSNSTRNFFHSIGGLSYVCELLFEPQSVEVQQAALYALGCATEKNHVNQLKLCTERMFSFLASLLVIPPDSTHTLPVAVAYLSGCLMSNNVRAQRLTKDTGLLAKLISLFKCTLPVSCEADSSQPVSNQELWSSVSSALCAATNNPQNETNQCECIKLFPAALSVLSAKPVNENAVRLSISLIASCTANNKGAQDRLRLVGGLKTLVATLENVIHTMSSSALPSELPLHIANTLSAAGLNHCINCETLVELECIELLLRLLQVPDIGVTTQLNVIVCLGMLAEENEVGRNKVTKSEGISLLVDILAHSQNGELNKAVTFLLQSCVEKAKPSSPPQSVIIECAAQVVDQLPIQEIKGSTESGSSIKDVLDKLSRSKLPAKDLVKTWLSNCVPSNECSSQPEEGEKTCGQAEANAAVKTSYDQSRMLQVLMDDKEHLEALLKDERTEKEKLKQELLSQKQVAKNQTKEIQTVSPEVAEETFKTKVKGIMDDKKRLESLLKQERTESKKLEQELLSQKQISSSQTKETQTMSQEGTQTVPQKVHKSTKKTKVKAVIKKNVRYSSRPSHKQATQTNLISKISQLQLSHKISKEVPQSRERAGVKCDHQCIGCKPRLKCPIVNSRNLIKLLLNDQYTCSYHHTIALKFKKDTKKGHPSPRSLKSLSPHTLHSYSPHTSPPLMHATPHHSNTYPPHLCTTPSLVGSVESEISVGQETPLDYTPLSKARSSDSDYVPSPSTDDTGTAFTQTHHSHSSAQIQRGFNPQTYRLLPRTCGPSQKLRPRPKVLADVSNKPVRKTRPTPLSVFNYSSPGLKQPSSAHIVVKNTKVVKSRAKAVPWSRQEESFLMEGVQLIGTGQWRHILAAYPFHLSRDSSSLRVKYKNMMAHQ